MSTRGRQGEYVRGVFEILRDADGPVRAAEVLAALEERLTLTDHEAGDYERNPGVRRFEKMVRFATIPAVKAGWLVKSRGEWLLTESGLEALQRYADPESLMRASVRAYGEWRSARDDAEAIDGGDEEPAAAAELSAVVTLEESEEAAWKEIRAYLGSMDPFHFQDLCAALLEAMGYHVIWRAPRNRKDQGVDLIAHSDPLGTTSPRIKVQVKRRVERVDHEELRAFLANVGNQDVGIFIALAGYTSEADRHARGQENRMVTLIDDKRFFDLWVAHLARLTEEGKRLLPLRPVYHLAPEE